MKDGAGVRAARALAQAPIQSLALPMSSGPSLFAFWVKRTALNDTRPPLPRDTTHRDGWYLLYVGASPPHAGLGYARLDRVIHNQVHGSLASSNLRRTLAALLLDHLELKPVVNGKYGKVENIRPLTQWMLQNCGFSLLDTWEPWELSAAVVGELRPLLNFKGNRHPFRLQVSEARRNFLRLCGVGQPPAEQP